jgi:thymidylate synthase (FAD)
MLLMRTSKEAHPQMREVMIPLLAEFQERIPILFEDIVPLERQAVAIRRGR